ncbi:autotransporter domain-containing protein [Candidatus Tisiphia endosymbiont of Micropterix aruncella]|uniref:autotransporter domain-containing protein n=1 Tax=Candidatus Tisiphia endosymbiont of Micropterix aruncella TaxID=3066271 RepID=UPI003AA98681
MVLFNKLQNNFLINRSNRYLVTRCIIFLFFLLQGFGTSNVLAAGLRNEQIYSNDLENWNVKQGVSERSVHEVRQYANTPQFYETNSSNHLSINLPHLDPTTNREYFENEIEATLQLIDEARGELTILEQTRNAQIIDRFEDYDNELKKVFGLQNNYYPRVLKLLKADYLTLLNSHRKYSLKKEMIEEKISDNKTLQGIKKKGLTAIEQLIKSNSEEYDKAQSEAKRKAFEGKKEYYQAQSEAERKASEEKAEYYKAQSEAKLKALVDKEKSLSEIKKELEETPHQDAVSLNNLKNENNKQGGSEYNVVNAGPESIYEGNFSDHLSIVKILKKIDLSPQELGYDDNAKETLYTNQLNEVNKNLEDLAQKISETEQQESILKQEKDNYDQLSSAINIKKEKIRKLNKTKKYCESKLDCKEADNLLPTLPKKKLQFRDVAAHIISIIKAQPQTSNNLVSVKSPYISLDDQPPPPSLSMQTEILPYQIEASVVTPLILDTPNNETLTDKAIPQVNTKSLHDEFQEFSTENDGNNQRKEIITRRHSVETEQPKYYQDKKTITRTFSLELPRPQSLDEGFFSHHSTSESEKEEWSDSEDESPIDFPLKRFSRSSSLAPLDPLYYSRRSSDALNLDSSDKSLDSKLDDEESKPPRLYRRSSSAPPILQSQPLEIDRTPNATSDQDVAPSQNSNEIAVVTFLPITQEAMPIVTESQSLAKTTPPVTKLQYPAETIAPIETMPSVAKLTNPPPLLEPTFYEDKPPPITQEQSSTMHAIVDQVVIYNVDNKQGVSENNVELHEYENPPKLYKTKRQKRSIAVHDIFEDNLGLEELFKEEAVPIVANEQPPEAKYHAVEHIVDNDQPLAAAPAPQPPADVVHVVKNDPPAVQPPVANEQHPVADHQPLAAAPAPQPPADVVHVVKNDPPAVQPPVANEQHPVADHQPLAAAPAPQPPADVVHVVENDLPAVQPPEDEHLAANGQPQKPEHDIFDEDNLGLEELFKEEAVPIVANDQPPADVVHVKNDPPAVQPLAANDQPQEDQPQKDKHHADNDQSQKDEQIVDNKQTLVAAPQPPAETIILVEKKPYIPPINFDIEQNIAKYTTYIEFDYLDLISNALSTRNNLLKHNSTVNMAAAGDNDYYIKKGGWIQVMNSTSKQKGNTLPFKNNQQGFVLGFDAQPLDELIIGIAYANANSYTEFQSIFNDKQNTILHVAAIYSKYTLSPNMYLSSYLKYGKAFIKNLGKRDTISINSKTKGYVGRAKLETHYKVDLDKFLFKPMVGIIFDRFLIKNFTEYRKDFNINVPTRKGKRVSLETRIDFSKRILVKNISIIPKVHFKLDHTILLNNSTDIINFTSIEHHTQTVAITKSLRPSPKNVMYTLGGCINMQSVSALELGAGYDYSLKKNFTTHSFYVNGSVKF